MENEDEPVNEPANEPVNEPEPAVDNNTQDTTSLDSTIPADDILSSQEIVKNTFHDLFFGKDYPKFNKQLWSAMPILFGRIANGIAIHSVVFVMYPVLGSALKGNDNEPHTLVGLTYLIGILFSCLIMSSRGRQRSLIWESGLSMLVWIALILPPTKWIYAICFLAITSLQAMTDNVNLGYITEIMEPDLRGFFLALASAVEVLGALLAESVGYRQTFFWPVLIGLYMVFPYISLILSMAVPESPVWLLINGREPLARRRYTWLNGITEENEENLLSLTNYTEHVLEEKKRGRLRILGSKSFLKPLMILALMHSVRITAAYPMMRTYAVSRTHRSGNPQTAGDAALLTASWGHYVEMLTSAALVFLIVRCRRRIQFFVSAGCTVLSFFTLLIGMYFDFDNTSTLAIYLSYVIVANLGVNTIPYFMTAEYFPQLIREHSSALVLTYNHYAEYFILPIFGYTSKEILTETELIDQQVYYWIMLTAHLVLSVATFFVMPDTDGLTLQQIEEQMATGPWLYIDPRDLFAINKAETDTADTDAPAKRQDADDDEDADEEED